jgi:hypothetical protein
MQYHRSAVELTVNHWTVYLSIINCTVVADIGPVLISVWVCTELFDNAVLQKFKQFLCKVVSSKITYIFVYITDK